MPQTHDRAYWEVYAEPRFAVFQQRYRFTSKSLSSCPHVLGTCSWEIKCQKKKNLVHNIIIRNRNYMHSHVRTDCMTLYINS